MLPLDFVLFRKVIWVHLLGKRVFLICCCLFCLESGQICCFAYKYTSASIHVITEHGAFLQYPWLAVHQCFPAMCVGCISFTVTPCVILYPFESFLLLRKGMRAELVVSNDNLPCPQGKVKELCVGADTALHKHWSTQWSIQIYPAFTLVITCGLYI